jgi:hypothetical protein
MGQLDPAAPPPPESRAPAPETQSRSDRSAS